MKKDLYCLSAEIYNVSMIIQGLSNQLDNDITDSLNVEALNAALQGISMHLKRISDDISAVEREIILKLWKESDENYITFLSQLHNNNLYQFYSKNRDTINKLIGLDKEGTDNMI